MKEKIKKIPIFFHTSHEYSVTVAVTIASILYNTDSFIEFFILEEDVSNFRKKQIESLKERFKNFSITWISYRENKDLFDLYLNKVNITNLYKKQWPNIHSFCTPFIPLLLTNYDKVLYLDLDLVVLDKIDLLYDLDIANKYLGVVPDIVAPLNITAHQQNLNINIPYSEFNRYFCAGVLLINAKKFRDENIIDKYFELANKDTFPVCDQDILNTLFSKDDCLQIEQKFDVIIQPTYEQLSIKNIPANSEDFLYARVNTVIRHYADIKPWNVLHSKWASYQKFHHADYWFFAKMTPFFEGLVLDYQRSIYDALVAHIKIINKDTKKNKSKFNFIKTIIKKFINHYKKLN